MKSYQSVRFEVTVRPKNRAVSVIQEAFIQPVIDHVRNTQAVRSEFEATYLTRSEIIRGLFRVVYAK